MNDDTGAHRSVPPPGAAPPGAATAPGAAGPGGPRVPVAVHRFGDPFTYFLTRLLAFVVDTFGVAFVIATFAFNQLDAGQLVYARTAAASLPLIVALSFGGALLLSWLCEGLFGTTLGKLLFALGVGRVRGGRAGFGRALVRRLIAPIDLLLVGPIVALVTPNHQRLGDLATGTVVARARIGFLAPVIAIALFAGIAYAQVTFGGGLTSALAVSAATTTALPALGGIVAGATGLLHPAGPGAAPAPLPETPSPAPIETPAPPATAPALAQTPSASQTPAEAPSTGDGSGSTPAPDGTPATDETDQPEATPTTSIQ